MSEPKYEIRNIRRGKGARAHMVFARLYHNDDMIMSATLDYIVSRLNEILKK